MTPTPSATPTNPVNSPTAVPFTPAQSPIPTSPASDVTWADAVSALSDAAAAGGTVLTLFFIAWTVRQQGKALGLQIQQLQAEREVREAARTQEQRDAQQRKIMNARRVRISSYEMEHDPKPDVYAMGPFITDQAERLLAEIRMRETGMRPWRAAAIDVTNGSDTVISNLDFFGDNLPRPQYILRKGTTSLIEGHELDQLGLSGEATFIWLDTDEATLHLRGAELQFSDEDAYRWRTGLDGKVARIDHLE